jgi:phage minor structural protein
MFVGYVGNQPLFATSQPKGKEIVSGTLTDEINSVSALEFTLPPSNDMAGQIVPHASVIRLESDGTEIFCGTANSVSKNFRGDTVVSCDGMIALMADVIKEPFTASSYEIEGYVAAIVKNYNDGVTSDKEIKVGQVSGFEGQTFSVSHSTECKNIFELLKELRSEKGGYIWASYIGGDVYINYTKTIGSRNSQQIAFGSNLVSIEDQLEVGTLVTRVWPLGKEGLTIASVNDGKAYLQNTDVELRYGRVDKTIQVDSDDPSVVKSYGQAYLTRYATMNNTITLTAVDLHNLDKTISSFEVGDAVRVLSPPHGIDAEMVVNSVSTDLVKLSNSRITLGAKKGSITSVISSGVGSGGSGGFTGGGGGGGASIVVDNTLSLTSINPVENKVITVALAGKAAQQQPHSQRLA